MRARMGYEVDIIPRGQTRGNTKTIERAVLLTERIFTEVFQFPEADYDISIEYYGGIGSEAEE